MSVRIVHIGVGIRGRHWVEFVNNHPDTVSAACVDPQQAALDEIKSRFGEDHCQFSTDLDKALKTTEADAVLITSPSVHHAENALMALDKGLAVMTEKPFAADVAQARSVLKRADEVGKPVLVAENYRYWPAERTVRKLVQEDLLDEFPEIVFLDQGAIDGQIVINTVPTVIEPDPETLL